MGSCYVVTLSLASMPIDPEDPDKKCPPKTGNPAHDAKTSRDDILGEILKHDIFPLVSILGGELELL